MYNAFHFNTILKLNSSGVFSPSLPIYGAKEPIHPSRLHIQCQRTPISITP